MAISYDKLFKELKKRNLSKTDLRLATGIGQNTLAKLGKNEPISMEVLFKICNYLNCKVDDILDFSIESGDCNGTFK